MVDEHTDECSAISSTACQADHAGVYLACGAGTHSTASSSVGSVCDECTTAHCLQCPLGVCSVCDGTEGFSSTRRPTHAPTSPPPRRVPTWALSPVPRGCSPTGSVCCSPTPSSTVDYASRPSAWRATTGSSSMQRARASRPSAGRQTMACSWGALTGTSSMASGASTATATASSARRHSATAARTASSVTAVNVSPSARRSSTTSSSTSARVPAVRRLIGPGGQRDV